MFQERQPIGSARRELTLFLAPRAPFPIRHSTISASAALRQGMAENNDGGIEQIPLLDGFQDSFGGVTVEMKKEYMNVDVFAPLLRASMSSWQQQGKQAVWIKLPFANSHLAEVMVKEGFRYHHSEPSYLILVRSLPATPNPIPANAFHRVGFGALVLNEEREVLVVQDNRGRVKVTGAWKLPTGDVPKGEDICHAVVREVKEETGVDTEFIEVLCIRQNHKSFSTKSDLFFLCVLQPQSSSIEKQNVEVEAAQWMPIEEYAAQPFIVGNKELDSMAKICLARANDGCPGFAPLATTTRRGKRSYIYCNNPELVENFASSI